MNENREKGVATSVCPRCGRELMLLAQPDGGVVAEWCLDCYPPSEVAAQAGDVSSQEVQPPEREAGTVINNQQEESTHE